MTRTARMPPRSRARGAPRTCRARGETARTDQRDARALGLHPAARLRVIRPLDELLLPRAYLQRQCALRGLGQHQLRIEARADLVREPEPVEAARGEHDRIE